MVTKKQTWAEKAGKTTKSSFSVSKKNNNEENWSKNNKGFSNIRSKDFKNEYSYQGECFFASSSFAGTFQRLLSAGW